MANLTLMELTWCWFECVPSCFKIRHNISSAILSGERASVDAGTVEYCMDEITKGYGLCDQLG